MPKLLVVDDIEDIATSLSSYFSNKGYEMCVATNPAAALALTRSTTPDAVILDLGLPSKREGLELCQALRRISDVVIVVYSGWVASADRLAALEAGADHFLAKPASLTEIEDAIMLGRRRAPIRYGAALREAPKARPESKCG